MRNLKKILALVLALVMSLSLMATAGAADAAATSSETVTPAYEIALQVLGKDGLKVFGGYTDGTIRPQNNITRAEVAAILYRIVTGDVTDAQAGIYTDMANVNFNDLTGANWAKGYINYCANAQLIVGVGGNQFKPLANITGYATLAMILRALGYDKNGEFKGSGWEIRTASKARELGILKNVSENQLGSSATRELVAELLFRAMLCSKVTYNALTQDYDETGVTLGYEVFKLEEVEGVVVANEYADVRRDADGRGYDSVQPADTTVLRDGDGKDRIIRIGSELDDLGMTRRAYTVEDKTVRNTYDLQVLALEDIDKDTVVYDDGEKLTSLSFSGARTDKDTQYFINYGEEAEDLKTTIKVTYQAKVIADTISARTEALAITAFCTKYNLKESALSKYDATSNPNGQLKVEPTYVGSGNYRIIYEPKTLGEIAYASSDYVIDELYRVDKGHIYSIVEINGDYYYRVEIAPGNVLSSADKDMIKAIFNTANLNPEGTTVGLIVNGEVFRGTQSRYDYSDWQSYESFMADCLETVTEAKNTTLSGNSIGWRLRVIDNDKDGYIDWVFQTRYTVTTVNKVAEDGTITLDTDETVLNPWTDNDKVNSLASKTAAMPGETVAAGDVVLYATIDGVNRVWKAEEVANVRVESINRTAATITTADNATYTESTVHEHTSKKELIDSGVGNMAGKTAYTLYLDKYGNLAAFSQNLTGKLTLLTDGWSNVQKNGIEYAVKAWDTETQKFVQYDVTSGGNLFVGTDITNNNWNRIANFSPLNCYWNSTTGSYEDNDVRTIMAYVETDGETATLTPVDMIYDTQRLNASRDVKMIDMGTKIPDSSVSNTGTIYNTTYVGQSNWSNGYQNDPNYRNGVYYLNGGDVEVRALSNTVYYYVYRTWYGSSYSMVVNQVTGYSAGANYLTAAQKQYVEDVYVVGTKASHVTATGAPNQIYYTADAVVVELNDDFYAHFKNDHEEIFIYDFEEVINSVNLEKVKAINGKGEAVEFTIDLTRSDRIYTEGSNKGREPAPGLFYVWRTNETGDIWAISRMSHAQIRESGHYDVGTVGYSKFTGTYDYFNIYNWYCGNSGYHWDAGHGDHTNMNEATDAVLQKERVGTANSAYYTLGYSSNSYGYVSSLNKGEAEAIMTEHANDIANGATNEVLVRYDSSNKIVYAVSFNHVYNNDENYAQKVYRGVLLDQAPVKAATNVTWYGISDGGIQVLDRTFSDEEPAAQKITASYQAALEWKEANDAKRVPATTPLVVENAADYYVTDVDGKTVKEIPIAPIGGQEYTVRVKTLDGDWVDYVVKAVAASTDTSLTYNGVKYENGAVITYNGAENTIRGVLDNYFTWDAFATADVTSAVDENGKPVNAFTQWGNGYTATVVVTAENGEATYTIKFVKGNTPDVPEDLEAARKAADEALALMTDAEIEAITDAAKKQAVKDAKAALVEAVKGTDVKKINNATDALKAAVEAAKEEPTPAEITVKASYKYADLDPIEQTLVKDEQYTVSGKVYTLDKDAVELPDFSGMGECTYAVKINGATATPNAAGNYEYTLKDTDTAVNVEVTITPKSETPKPDDGWHEGEPPLERRVSRVLSEDDGTKPIWRYVYTSPDKKPSNTLDFGRSGLEFVEARLSISKSTETEYCWIVVAKVAATVDVKTIVAAVTFTKNTDKPIVSDEVKAAREAAIEELTKAADAVKALEGADTAAVDAALKTATDNVNGSTTVDAVTAAKDDGLKAIEALKPEADTYDVTITNSAEADGVTVTTTPATLTGLAKDTVVTITLAGVPETKTAKVVAGTETLTAETDGSYKLTVTADVTVTISLEDKTPVEDLTAKKAAAVAELKTYAEDIEKAYGSNDIVKGWIADELEKAQTAVNAATTEEALTKAVTDGKDAIKTAAEKVPAVADYKTEALATLKEYTDYIEGAVTMTTTQKDAYDKAVAAAQKAINDATSSTAVTSALSSSYSPIATAAGTSLAELKGMAAQEVQKAADAFISKNGVSDEGVLANIKTAVDNARAEIGAKVTDETKLGLIPDIVKTASENLEKDAEALIAAKKENTNKVNSETLAQVNGNKELGEVQKNKITAAAQTARDAIIAAATVADVNTAYKTFADTVAKIVADDNITVENGKVTVRYHLGKNEKLTTAKVEAELKTALKADYYITGPVGDATIDSATGEITTNTSKKVLAFNDADKKSVEVTLVRYYEIYVGDSETPFAKVDEVSSSNATVSGLTKGFYVVDDSENPGTRMVGDTGAGTPTAYDVSSGTLTIAYDKLADMRLYVGAKVTIDSGFSTNGAVATGKAVVEVVKTANDDLAATGAATEVGTGKVVRKDALLRINPVKTSAAGGDTKTWELAVCNTDTGATLISKTGKNTSVSADVATTNVTPAVTYTVGTTNITIKLSAGTAVKITDKNGNVADLGVQANLADNAVSGLGAYGIADGNYIAVGKKNTDDVISATAAVTVTGGAISGISSMDVFTDGVITLVPAAKVTFAAEAVGTKYEIKYGNVTLKGEIKSKGTNDDENLEAATGYWLPTAATVTLTKPTSAGATDSLGVKYVVDSKNVVDKELNLSAKNTDGFTVTLLTADTTHDSKTLTLTGVKTDIYGVDAYLASGEGSLAKIFADQSFTGVTWSYGGITGASEAPTASVVESLKKGATITAKVIVEPGADKYFAKVPTIVNGTNVTGTAVISETTGNLEITVVLTLTEGKAVVLDADKKIMKDENGATGSGTYTVNVNSAAGTVIYVVTGATPAAGTGNTATKADTSDVAGYDKYTITIDSFANADDVEVTIAS